MIFAQHRLILSLLSHRFQTLQRDFVMPNTRSCACNALSALNGFRAFSTILEIRGEFLCPIKSRITRTTVR